MLLRKVPSVPARVPGETRKRAVVHLNEYLGETEQLVRRIGPRGGAARRYSDKWYAMISELGGGLTALYRYHNVLVNQHPFFSSPGNIPRTPDQRSQYYVASCYMDMVVSRAKHAFFTELPMEPHHDPAIEKRMPIIVAGERIFYLADGPELKSCVSAFYFHLFLSVDFLFKDDQEKTGAFTTFAFSSGKFKEAKRPFEDTFKVNSESEFRAHASAIVREVIATQLDDHTSTAKPREFYIDVVDRIIGKDKYKGSTLPEFEPFTYYLANKLWKFGKFFQERYRAGTTKTDESNYDVSLQKHASMLTAYVQKSLKDTNDYYAHRITSEKLFEKMYDLDRDVCAKLIYKWVHPKQPYLRYVSVPAGSPLPLKKQALGFDTEVAVQGLLKCVNATWKLGAIFSKVDHSERREAVLSIIHWMYACGNRQNDLDKKQLIGIYKSGALLAHCLNICLGIPRNVGLFTTYPYIALHSRTIDMVESDSVEKFLFVDESYKTGFTAALGEGYVQRHRFSMGVSCSVIAVTDFPEYRRADYGKVLSSAFLKKNDRLTALVDLKTVRSTSNGETVTYQEIADTRLLDAKPLLGYSVEEYIRIVWSETEGRLNSDNFRTDLLDISQVRLENLESDVVYSASDGTRILSDTKKLFEVAAALLWKVIRDPDFQLESTSTIYLCSPTDEAKLIAETMALIACIVGFEHDFVFVPPESADRVGAKIFYVALGADTLKTAQAFREIELDGGRLFNAILTVFESDEATHSYAKCAHKLISLARR